MTTDLSDRKVEVGSKAGEMFGNGFHCAEAVAAAVLQALGEDASEATAHATAFGGGVGESFRGDCGALAGALIAIGHLHGRREPGGDWSLPASLGAELREHFLRQHQTAHCATLRERFGEAHQMAACRRLVIAMSERLMARLASPAHR
jgi:C_GCAxxG_C_C family probable redox protein